MDARRDLGAAVASGVKRATTSWILLGLALIVLGLLSIGSPLVTGVAVAWIVGFLLLAAGVAEVVDALRVGGSRGVWTFLGGLLFVIGGLGTVLHPLLGLGFLTWLLAAFFVASGVAGTAVALRVRPAKGWAWVLVDGLLSLLLGVLIWASWPVSGAWAVGTLVGVRLISRGVALILAGSAVRGLVGDVGEAAGAR